MATVEIKKNDHNGIITIATILKGINHYVNALRLVAKSEGSKTVKMYPDLQRVLGGLQKKIDDLVEVKNDLAGNV